MERIKGVIFIEEEADIEMTAKFLQARARGDETYKPIKLRIEKRSDIYKDL